MSFMDWAATLASLSAFGAALVAATSWVLRNYLKNYVHELKPNGGSSMKDTINKIHAELTDLRISVARLEGRFTQHVEDGNE